MDCSQLNKYLIDYLLEELEPVLEMKVNEHLNECSKCQKKMENMESFFTNIKEDKNIKADKKVLQNIKERIGIERKPLLLRFLNRPVKLYYAIATLVFGLLIMSVTDVINEKIKPQQKEVKKEYKILYKPSGTDSDSIVFYSAPSHRLGGT
jgi:predicted anti-sigma-YlaC factor YlaD